MADADAALCVTAELIQPAQLEGAEGQAAEPSQSLSSPEAERVLYSCGEHAEARMALIVKAAIAYSTGIDEDGKENVKIWEWGSKKVLGEILGTLNKSLRFNGTLKASTLESKCRAKTICTDWEKFIKLSQNGGHYMSELDKLYLNLADKTQAWERSEKEKMG